MYDIVKKMTTGMMVIDKHTISGLLVPMR